METIQVDKDFAGLPVERLYAYLSEHENLKTIFGARVERLRDGSDGQRNGAGSVRRLSLAGAMPFEETVTEAIPNELIRYRITKGSPLRDHEGVMRFSSLPGGGSHLSYTISFGAAIPGLAKLLKSALGGTIGRGLRKVEKVA